MGWIHFWTDIDVLCKQVDMLEFIDGDSDIDGKDPL
jgi:hypothetical protein